MDPTKNTLDTELYHYGILGMKWGVRKDPEKGKSVASKSNKSVPKQKSEGKNNSSIKKKISYKKAGVNSKLTRKSKILDEIKNELLESNPLKARVDAKVKAEIDAEMQKFIEDQKTMDNEALFKASEYFKKNPKVSTYSIEYKGYYYSFSWSSNGSGEKQVYIKRKVDMSNGQDAPDYSEYRLSHSSSDFLEHYGVLGMKWGVRRSPEELGHKPSTRKGNKQSFTSKSAKKANKAKAKIEKAKARAEKRRQEILNDPGKLYKHRREFTKDEIEIAMRQFEWEKKLKQLSVDDVRLGAEKAQQYLKIAGTAVGAYNLTAQLYNAFRDPDDPKLPYIEKKNEEKKK